MSRAEMTQVGWLCQWGEQGAPNGSFHRNWTRNLVTERGFRPGPLGAEECPDCRPVFVPLDTEPEPKEVGEPKPEERE